MAPVPKLWHWYQSLELVPEFSHQIDTGYRLICLNLNIITFNMAMIMARLQAILFEFKHIPLNMELVTG